MKIDYMNDPADEIARGTSLYSPKKAGSTTSDYKLSYTKRNSNSSPATTLLDDALGITERNNNSSMAGTGGLADTALVVDPVKVDPTQVAPAKVNPPEDGSKTLKAEGMSRGMANFQAGAGIGLGLLSFLENRKTSKLQREALRHDIDTAKEHRANRQALGASFSAGLAKGLTTPTAPNPPAKRRGGTE